MSLLLWNDLNNALHLKHSYNKTYLKAKIRFSNSLVSIKSHQQDEKPESSFHTIVLKHFQKLHTATGLGYVSAVKFGSAHVW